MMSVNMPLNLEEVLDGILFPAAKVEILTFAGEQGASREAMTVLQALPVKSYHNMNEINEALGTVESQPGDANIYA